MNPFLFALFTAGAVVFLPGGGQRSRGRHPPPPRSADQAPHTGSRLLLKPTPTASPNPTSKPRNHEKGALRRSWTSRQALRCISGRLERVSESMS